MLIVQPKYEFTDILRFATPNNSIAKVDIISEKPKNYKTMTVKSGNRMIKILILYLKTNANENARRILHTRQRSQAPGRT